MRAASFFHTEKNMNLIIHVDFHIECEKNLGERIYYLISYKKRLPQNSQRHKHKRYHLNMQE